MSVFFVQNSPLVPAFVRNRPPFTSVHSHAGAQKSSGAFFHDMDRERCRKRRGRGRNALRASQGVRARDVMFNRNQKNDRFTDRFSDSIMLILYNVGVKND